MRGQCHKNNNINKWCFNNNIIIKFSVYNNTEISKKTSYIDFCDTLKIDSNQKYNYHRCFRYNSRNHQILKKIVDEQNLGTYLKIIKWEGRKLIRETSHCGEHAMYYFS